MEKRMALPDHENWQTERGIWRSWLDGSVVYICSLYVVEGKRSCQ